MKKQRWRIPTMQKPANYHVIRWNIAHFCLEQGYEYQFVNEEMPVRFYMNGTLFEAQLKSERFVRSPLNWCIECREMDAKSDELGEIA